MTFISPKLPAGWKWSAAKRIDASNEYVVRAVRSEDSFFYMETLVIGPEDKEDAIRELFEYTSRMVADKAARHLDATTQHKVIEEIFEAFNSGGG